jgi:hypothetical protein
MPPALMMEPIAVAPPKSSIVPPLSTVVLIALPPEPMPSVTHC